MILIYTDGSSRGNPGNGGWGSILMHGDYKKEFSQGYKFTTNNRMELLGVIESLKKLKRNDLPITIYSDSKYVIDSIQKGWLRNWIKIDFKGKKNKDLWIEYDNISSGFDINYVWVKGHSSNEYNNRCDVLATTAAMGRNLIEDVGYLG